LVYLILCRLVQLSSPDDRPTTPLFFSVPVLSTLLFVSHPVQTEAVTYVWGRSDLLCASCYFSSFLFFVKAQNVPGRQPEEKKSKKRIHPRNAYKGSRYYAWALVFFLLALTTKAAALSLPFLLLFYDYYFLPRGDIRTWRASLLKRHSLFFLLAAARLFLFYSPVGKSELIYALKDNLVWYERLDIVANALTQCHAVVQYLRVLLVPTQLNIDHDFPAAYSLFDVSVIASLGILLLLLSVAVLLFQRAKVASFSICWFFVTLSFFFFFSLPDFFVERRLYLPSMGFCTCVALLAQYLATRLGTAWRNGTLAAAVRGAPLALVLVYTIATIQRNAIWSDPAALWFDAVIKSPSKARPHANLAIVNLEQKRFTEAVTESQKALSLNPASAEAHYSLLDAYVSLGWWRLAVEQFMQTLRTHPYYAVQWYSWRHEELQRNRQLFLPVFSTFEQELKTAPGNADGHIALGFLYVSLLGDEQRALWHFEEGLKFPSQRFRRHAMLRIVQDLRRSVSRQQLKKSAPQPRARFAEGTETR
jgi:tetratricopeptide (TPR) repeat protein